MTKRGLVRSTINAGLLGGFVVVYLAAVGMIGSFSIRNLIGDQVTLGRVLMALPAFLTGYLVARPRVRGGIVERIGGRTAVLAGVGAGVLTGAFGLFPLGLARLSARRLRRLEA